SDGRGHFFVVIVLPVPRFETLVLATRWTLFWLPRTSSASTAARSSVLWLPRRLTCADPETVTRLSLPSTMTSLHRPEVWTVLVLPTIWTIGSLPQSTVTVVLLAVITRSARLTAGMNSAISTQGINSFMTELLLDRP